MQAAVLTPRYKLRIIGVDGVEMWCEQDGLADFASRLQACDEIGTSGQHLLKFDSEPGPPGDGREKISNVPFSGVRMARREKGRIDAGESDQFDQELFGTRHVWKV
jgi:hypothetical protein